MQPHVAWPRSCVAIPATDIEDGEVDDPIFEIDVGLPLQHIELPVPGAQNAVAEIDLMVPGQRVHTPAQGLEAFVTQGFILASSGWDDHFSVFFDSLEGHATSST